MNAVLHVAWAEVLEHRRQPWMLLILVLGYLILLATQGVLIIVIHTAIQDPTQGDLLRQQAAATGVDLDSALTIGATLLATYQFTNLPLFVALFSGYSVLHDRTCGALVFLMLAPLSRRQLLAGKLLGALCIPTALHLCIVSTASLGLLQFDAFADHAEMFGADPAWWVAFAVGTPASALFIGALGTVISALSRDVRTSMQYVRFIIGVLSAVFGFFLVDCIRFGVVVQLAFAAGCLVLATLTLLVGAALISRDIEPAP